MAEFTESEVTPIDDRSRSTDIDADIFIKFATDKNIQIICELCGNTKWEVQNEYGDTTAVPLIKKENGGLKAYFPTVLTVCSHCGNVRHIWRHRILEWLEKREKQEASSD